MLFGPRRIARRPRGSSTAIACVAGRDHTASSASCRCPYQPENNDIPVAGRRPRAFDALRTIAVSRNLPRQLRSHHGLLGGLGGLKLAQVAFELRRGRSCTGRSSRKHIFHMAGATSPQLQTEARNDQSHPPKLAATPVQRNTFYEPIKVLADGAPSANEAEPPSGKSKVLEDNFGDGVKPKTAIEETRLTLNKQIADAPTQLRKCETRTSRRQATDCYSKPSHASIRTFRIRRLTVSKWQQKANRASKAKDLQTFVPCTDER